MAWPYTQNVDWGLAQEADAKFDDQPVDANTVLYAGQPAGFNAGSAPANCIRPLNTADKFAGFVERAADNTTATAANPNLFNIQNFGDGTTGAGGAKVRLRTAGRIRFDARVPNNAGTAGSIQGLVGTQADVDVAIYYNGTGFTTTAGGNVLVGYISAVGTTLFGVTYWELTFRSDVNRNS